MFPVRSRGKHAFSASGATLARTRTPFRQKLKVGIAPCLQSLVPPNYSTPSTVALLDGAALTGGTTVTASAPLYSTPSTVALLVGAAFTGATPVNGSTPLYCTPSAVALLDGAAFTGATTVNGSTPLFYA